MSTNSADQRIKEAPDASSNWALLERVAASAHLKRATRLQELLLYLGKCSLKEGYDKISEHKIGTDVFGRPEGYDTSADNIVRTSVSELRKRIDAYFESEGRGETLLMQIPRWSYIPIFTSRPAEERDLSRPSRTRPCTNHRTRPGRFSSPFARANLPMVSIHPDFRRAHLPGARRQLLLLLEQVSGA